MVMDDARRETCCRIVEAIEEVGPSVPAVARQLGLKLGRVRSFVDHYVRGPEGFDLVPVVDYARLGMRVYSVVLAPFPRFRPAAKTFFSAMGELGYAWTYGTTLPQAYIVVSFAVPEELYDRHVMMVGRLEERGLFHIVRMQRDDMVVRPKTSQEALDLDGYGWQFDWDSRRDLEQNAPIRPSVRAEYDAEDLKAINGWQRQATSPPRSYRMAGIADGWPMERRTLEWHLRDHVVGRRLVTGYRFRWPGAVNPHAEGRRRVRSLVTVELQVSDPSGRELLELRKAVQSVPFLWTERIGMDYTAQFHFPIEDIIPAYRFIAKAMEPFEDRSASYMLSRSEALEFPLWSELYAGGEGWTLDEEGLVARAERTQPLLKPSWK
ncbi:MAG: hypothetical protein ABSF83_00595 [Nitrososphaerales archaeon]|jgi:hypothetical protein